MLITSLSVTAELIGCNPESGAFVYGSMSLSDKVSNGVAVILIQKFIPSTIDTCTDCQLYYRDILFFVCGGAAILGALCMASLIPYVIGERWRDRRPANGYESLPGGVDHSPQRIEDSEVRRRQQATVNSEADERTPLIA